MLNFEIPKGRKAGKFLRKELNIKDDSLLTDLVASLLYDVVSVTDRNETFRALRECHSCQSNGNAPELFFSVWSSVPDVDLLCMVDGNGTYVARCLVNFKEKTFAPQYGDKHFLLLARLIASGFTAGKIAEYGAVASVVEREMTLTMGIVPKSRVETSVVTLTDVTPDEIEKAREKMNSCRYNGRCWFSYKLAEKTLKSLLIRRKKFKRAGKRYGVKDGVVSFSVKKFISLDADGWKLVDEIGCSSLYVDYDRKFVPYHRVGFKQVQ